MEAFHQPLFGWVEIGGRSTGFLRVNFCQASLAELARRLIPARSDSAFRAFVVM
jgi:hypothetical protein